MAMTPERRAYLAALDAAGLVITNILMLAPDRAQQILDRLDDDALARVNAAAGDLRILTAETVAKRAASHTPPAVAAADGTTGWASGISTSEPTQNVTGKLSGPTVPLADLLEALRSKIVQLHQDYRSGEFDWAYIEGWEGAEILVEDRFGAQQVTGQGGPATEGHNG